MDGSLQYEEITKPTPEPRPGIGNRTARGGDGGRPPQGWHSPSAGGGPVDARHLREIVGAVFVLGITEALRLEEPELDQWD